MIKLIDGNKCDVWQIYLLEIGEIILLMKKFNHRFSEIMKRRNVKFKGETNEKMVFYYRKGRMPTLNDQQHSDRNHSFICLTQPADGNLVYSNNPHRIQLQIDNCRRNKITMQMRKNQEKYYKKNSSQKISKNLSHNSQFSSPQKRVSQINTDRNQEEKPPIIYRKRSNKMEKQYKVIQAWATKGLKEINQKNRANSHEQITKQKNLFKGLRGMKYYYALARSLQIPPKQF